jgi:hypothetical protein
MFLEHKKVVANAIRTSSSTMVCSEDKTRSIDKKGVAPHALND